MGHRITTSTRLLEALGLGGLPVRSAQLNIDAGQVPTVEVELELTDGTGRPVSDDSQIVTVLRRYELVERPVPLSDVTEIRP